MAKTKDLPIDQADAPAKSVLIEIPVVPLRTGHVSRRIDITLNSVQAEGMHLLVSSLDRNGVMLENRARIVLGHDAVRWMLERIAAEAKTTD